MGVNNAYRLCLGLFKQSSTGTVYSSLPEQHSTTTWDLTESIIPKGYKFTNYQEGDTTVETVEYNLITGLSKTRQYGSGAVTPPTFTFANMADADEDNIISTLDKLTGIDEPFKCLLVAGAFTSESGGKRTYTVFKAAVGIVTTDGGRTGEAKNQFTGALGLQSCHIPLVGTSECNATMEWDTTTQNIKMIIGT